MFQGTSDDTIAKIQAKRQMMQPLLPMPEDMLQEAWFLMGGAVTTAPFLFENFLKRELWALKSKDFMMWYRCHSLQNAM
ncbi:hypothetical protein J6590_089466, partial [Homalodisca vitripennis]